MRESRGLAITHAPASIGSAPLFSPPRIKLCGKQLNKSTLRRNPFREPLPYTFPKRGDQVLQSRISVSGVGVGVELLIGKVSLDATSLII